MKVLQGVDLVKIARVEAAIVKQGARLLDRVFSRDEQRYCESKRMKFEHYAARFSAKEAFIKATGLKLKRNAPLAGIEVRHEKTGKPVFWLSPAMRKAAGLGPDDRVELSIAHERVYALATVVVIKDRKRI